MYKPADMGQWRGRVDDEEQIPSLRWHQKVQARNVQPDSYAQNLSANQDSANRGEEIVLLGFCCDEGVTRNKGRSGAARGPDAIRSVLANMAWPTSTHQYSISDAGDIFCEAGDMESAQIELGTYVAALLSVNVYPRNIFPVILGGGHETAWGSYLGIDRYLQGILYKQPQHLGIINFDAHLDLRNPLPLASSGTPFRQIALHRQAQKQGFNYCVIGMNPSANTAGLIQFAEQQKVEIIVDKDCHHSNMDAICERLDVFIARLDYLYMTVCLDVFPTAYAPGVSAPAALGVEPSMILALIGEIKNRCQRHNVSFLLADIAEMSPGYDLDQRTAKLAARVIYEIVF